MVEPTVVDRRNDDAFQNVRFDNAVNVSITTLCSMRCPMCSLAMPQLTSRKQAWHLTDDELQRLIPLLTGLQLIHITGGEPTAHPRFRSVVSQIKSLCAPRVYTLESNGFRVLQNLEFINDTFDRVFITQYVQDAVYSNSPDNRSIIEQAQVRLQDKLIIEPPVSHTVAHGQNTSQEMCSKAKNPGLPSGYANGKFYRCCVELGIEALTGTELGVPMDENWKTALASRRPHCAGCLYAGT